MAFPLIGVLHLPALPGAPRGGASVQAVMDHALRDAEALAVGGASGCIVENFGDAPFAERVEPHVTAMLAVVAREVRARFPDLEVGINALRNDGLASIGAAVASGAGFVRVNVLSGAMVTDQGLLQSHARELLLYRQRLEPGIRIVADVHVKHAVPLGSVSLTQSARDTWQRAGADVLIVTGEGTGGVTNLDQVARLKDVLAAAPIWVGSGVTLDQARDVAAVADGAIVGTALHRSGLVSEPLDVERVRAMRDALEG